MSYLAHLRDKVSYSPLPRIFMDALDKLGIQIRLFYILREGFTRQVSPQPRQSLDGYDIGFIGMEDLEEMAHIPYRPARQSELERRLTDGNLCLGAKRDGRLVAFTWCNLTHCLSDGYSFRLNVDEAYLFDAYTSPDLRGQGIAPALRYRLYEELARLGRTTLYSISERLNAPAIRFKSKLGATLVRSDWYVTLFWTWHFGPRGERPS
jgi:GNAT superfamily N-acetyltransferase